MDELKARIQAAEVTHWEHELAIVAPMPRDNPHLLQLRRELLEEHIKTLNQQGGQNE